MILGFTALPVLVLVGSAIRAHASEMERILSNPYEDDLRGLNTLDLSLFQAVLNNDTVSVRDLLAAGANPDTANMLPLEHAVTRGRNEIVIELLRMGAEFRKEYLLCKAAAAGHVSTVKLLIELGADPLESALIAAAFRGYLDCVKALVVAGADFHHVDQFGETAVDYAIQYGEFRVADFFDSIDHRESQSANAAIEFASHRDIPTRELAADIIQRHFESREGDPNWNLCIVSFAYTLKGHGIELFAHDYVRELLDGEWSSIRLELVRRSIAAYVALRVPLVQFDYIIAEFLVSADVESLLASEVISLGTHEQGRPFDFGFWESERADLVAMEGFVFNKIIRSSSLNKAISFFENLNARRFAIVAALRGKGIPDELLARIDEFMSGPKGIVDDLRYSAQFNAIVARL